MVGCCLNIVCAEKKKSKVGCLYKVRYNYRMKNIQLHIANAGGSLDDVINKINKAFNNAANVCGTVLGLDRVDVICVDDSSMVIPEIGVGGYTSSRHLMYLYIDPSRSIDEQEIFNTLCHEFHHARRFDGPGYGKTLFDAMIFEGLAVAFEQECTEADGFIPKELLKRKETKKLINKYASKFEDTAFDHLAWFIYDKDNELPRWAGYDMGYYIARKYLSAKNKKASDLVVEGPEKFAEFVRDTLRED